MFGTDIDLSYPVEIFPYTERYFCPLRCTKFYASRENTIVQLAVELQEQWDVVEDMYVHQYGSTKSADQDAVLRKNSTTHYAKWSPTRTTSFRSRQITAAAAPTNTSTLVLDICPRHRGWNGLRNTSARWGCFLYCTSLAQTPVLHAWNTPAESSATRYRWAWVFSCMNSLIKYLKVHLTKMTRTRLRVERSCVRYQVGTWLFNVDYL